MKKFIPKEKLGKKARKQLDTEQRSTWAFSPVTKKVESKKLYNRKRKGLFVKCWGKGPGRAESSP